MWWMDDSENESDDEDSCEFNSYQDEGYSDVYQQQYQPEYPHFYQQPSYQEQYFNQQQQPFANYTPYQQTEFQNQYPSQFPEEHYPPQNQSSIQSNIETMLQQMLDMMTAQTAKLSEMTACYETMGTQMAQLSASNSTCQMQEIVEETKSESIAHDNSCTMAQLLGVESLIGLNIPHYELVEEVDDESIVVEDGDEGLVEDIEEGLEKDEENDKTVEKHQKADHLSSKADRLMSTEGERTQKTDRPAFQPIGLEPHNEENRSAGIQTDRLFEKPIRFSSEFSSIAESQNSKESKEHFEVHSSSVNWDSLDFEQVLSETSVWGSLKNFELTGEGEYGEYSKLVVDESKTDPAAKGHNFRWLHNGLRDQICSSFARSSARSCNFLDYDDPGDEQRPSASHE